MLKADPLCRKRMLTYSRGYSNPDYVLQPALYYVIRVPSNLMETDEPQTAPDEWGQLSISYQELQTIPDALFSYPHSMLRLNLSHNNLTELPPEIGSLILLRDLDVSSNRLQKVDTSISACIRLRRLLLSNNELVGVPSELNACVMLEEINLTKNKLKEIPESLATLPALSELRLDNNNLRRLPTSLSLMPTLSVFTCTDNNAALDEIIPAAIQSNSLMIKWCLKLLLEYNEKEEAAQKICQELQDKVITAENEQQHLEGEVESLKNDVAALQAERPTKYLDRKRRLLAARARWSHRFGIVAGILCCRPLCSKNAARVSTETVAGIENDGASTDGSNSNENT